MHNSITLTLLTVKYQATLKLIAPFRLLIIEYANAKLTPFFLIAALSIPNTVVMRSCIPLNRGSVSICCDIRPIGPSG